MSPHHDGTPLSPATISELKIYKTHWRLGSPQPCWGAYTAPDPIAGFWRRGEGREEKWRGEDGKGGNGMQLRWGNWHPCMYEYIHITIFNILLVFTHNKQQQMKTILCNSKNCQATAKQIQKIDLTYTLSKLQFVNYGICCMRKQSIGECKQVSEQSMWTRKIN